MFENKVNLWHYTTLEGLEGILRTQAVWATHFEYLNDASELRYSKQVLAEVFLPIAKSFIEQVCSEHKEAQHLVDSNGGIERFTNSEVEDTLEILYSALLDVRNVHGNGFRSIPCIASFSQVELAGKFEQGNGLLSQWRGYGIDGGYAIIFNKEALCARFQEETSTHYYGIHGDGDVRYYINQESELADIRGKLDLLCSVIKGFYSDRVFGKKTKLDDVQFLDALASCMVFLKHGGFSQENEYRFYVFPHPLSMRQHPDFKDDPNKSFKEILFRSSNGLQVPYVSLFRSKNKQLPIERICIGPHKDARKREVSIKDFLYSSGLGHIEVYRSSIPFIGIK